MTMLYSFNTFSLRKNPAAMSAGFSYEEAEAPDIRAKGLRAIGPVKYTKK